SLGAFLIEAKRLLTIGKGPFEVTPADPDRGTPAVCGDQLWVQTQRLLAVGAGVVSLAFSKIDGGAVAEEGGIVRLEAEGFGVVGEGGLVLARAHVMSGALPIRGRGLRRPARPRFGDERLDLADIQAITQQLLRFVLAGSQRHQLAAIIDDRPAAVA